MRPCVKCGAPIGNSNATCAECGAQQVPSAGVNPETPVGKPDDITGRGVAWIDLAKPAAVLCLFEFPIVTHFLFGPTCVALAIVFVMLVIFVDLAIVGGVGG